MTPRPPMGQRAETSTRSAIAPNTNGIQLRSSDQTNQPNKRTHPTHAKILSRFLGTEFPFSPTSSQNGRWRHPTLFALLRGRGKGEGMRKPPICPCPFCSSISGRSRRSLHLLLDPVRVKPTPLLASRSPRRG